MYTTLKIINQYANSPNTCKALHQSAKMVRNSPPLSSLPLPPTPTNFHEKFKQIHEDIHIPGRNQSTICQNLTTPVNRCFYFRTNSDNRVQKYFGKHFPLISCLLSTSPISNVDYLDSTTLCNTKITIFNIDMGEGRKNSSHITVKLRKHAFSKNVCTGL